MFSCMKPESSVSEVKYEEVVYYACIYHHIWGYIKYKRVCYYCVSLVNLMNVSWLMWYTHSTEYETLNMKG